MQKVGPRPCNREGIHDQRPLRTARGPPCSPLEEQTPVKTLNANAVKFSSNTVSLSTQKGSLKTPRSYFESPR